LRVYQIGRAYQPADIDTGDAARQFLAWLADDAGPVLERLIRSWLVLPPDAGGLGALVESEADVATLQAEITKLCRPGHAPGRPARPAREPRPSMTSGRSVQGPADADPGSGASVVGEAQDKEF
jgi:hypothetical protein